MRPGNFSLLADLKDLFENHRSIAWVAWVGIVATSAIAASLGLAGSTIREQLQSDLEREQNGAVLVESGPSVSPSCSLLAFECPTPDLEIDGRFVEATTRAFGLRRVGELRESVVSISGQHFIQRRTRLLRINEPWLQLQPTRILAGRAFSSADYKGSENVALLGTRLYDSLAAVAGTGPTWVELEHLRFRVVGVIESGITAATSFDNSVVTPLRRRSWGPSREAIRLLVRTADQRHAPDERAEVETMLRQALRLRPKDPLRVSLRGLQEQTELLEETWQRLDQALWHLAMVLAATSSIGVGALQYAVASARRHELGVRRALGARRWQLVWLGAASSATFTIAATAVGAALACAGAYVTCQIMEVPLGEVTSALAVGVMPSLTAGAMLGALTFGHFARQSPASLLGKPQ